MLRLPQSARVRRRLFRGSLLGGAIVAVVLVVVLVPSHRPANPSPVGNEGPAQLAAVTPSLRLSTADRHAIDTTLDRFLPAGEDLLVAHRIPLRVAEVRAERAKRAAIDADVRRVQRAGP